MPERVKLTGGLSHISLDEVDQSTQEILVRVGEAGVEAMHIFTEPHDYKEELSKSLMWRTKRSSGGNEGGDRMIKKPSYTNEVNIGSANDHAWFREEGSSRHMTDQGSAEFIEALAEWCRVKLGFDPETEYQRFKNILNKIRRDGTAREPFAFPSIDMIRGASKNICSGEVRAFWRRRKRR